MSKSFKMSFLGKEYKFVRDESFVDFLKAVGLPEADVAKFTQFKPIYKIEKDGDGYMYTNVTPAGSKTTKFLHGVEFDDKVRDDLPIKCTFTVDGNKVTQVIKSDLGFATIIREFNGDELVATITASVWDGVAKRYYKA